MKAELRAWALGGPVAPERVPPPKPVVCAFNPAPVVETVQASASASAETIHIVEPVIAERCTIEEPCEVPEAAHFEVPAATVATADVQTAVSTVQTEDPCVESEAIEAVQEAVSEPAPKALPTLAELYQAAFAAEQPIATAEESGRSILILNREEPIRKLLRRVLERQGYRVREMGNCQELTLEQSVDLLITDPDEQRESLEAMHDIYPDMRIIVLSNSWDGAVGTSAVLPKPFRTDVLLESVRNALS